MSRNQQTKWDHLGEFLQQSMATQRVPGVSLGIWYDGETFIRGFGVISTENPLAATGDTLCQIGSITKTFTATTLLRLVDMGAVELDAPVRTYLPDFRVSDPSASAQATLRHLLTHTACWAGDFFVDTGPGDDALARYVAAMANLQQLAPLGQVWSYNNSGFKLMGRVIEQVTGDSFRVAMRHLLLDPLEMELAFFDPADILTYRFLVGHHVTAEGTRVARHWALPRNADPDGGLTCDVHHLLRFARFLLGDGKVNDGTRLLQSKSLMAMHTPQVQIWPGKEAMGLAWFINYSSPETQLWHSSLTNGQNGLLLLVPALDFILAVFTNANSGWTLIQDVKKWVFERYLGWQIPQFEPIETSIETLESYIGRYGRPFADIDIRRSDSMLTAQVTYKLGLGGQGPPPPSPPPMNLAVCEPDRLLILDGPFKNEIADVVRRPDGKIGWLRLNGRIHRAHCT